jgi:hypothetical protein
MNWKMEYGIWNNGCHKMDADEYGKRVPSIGRKGSKEERVNGPLLVPARCFPKGAADYTQRVAPASPIILPSLF